jgi:photosystem II stability/assembly factor-like uncharacterized protein
MYRLALSFLVVLFAVRATVDVTQAQTAAPEFLAFAFATSTHGWAGGGDGIAATDDGGQTWHSQYRGRRVDQLVIVRRRTVYALADGAIVRTRDDGATWQLVGQPQPALKRIAFTSDRDGFGIGIDQRLYTTTDGAATWQRSAFDKPVDALCFSDKRDGFVGGAISAPALGSFDGIATTSDGGRTWTAVKRPPTDGLVGIAGHALHCTRGSVYDLVDLGPQAGGTAYLLARSIDGGRTWSTLVTGGKAEALARVPHGPGTEATSMSAYSPQAAYVAGFCGACGPTGESAFGATTDAGKSWQNASLGPIGVTSAPVFTSAEHGWLGARVLSATRPSDVTDEVLVTDDAGRSWHPIFRAAR